MPDAITLLKADHREVKRMFREFRKAEDGSRGALAERIIGELVAHAHIENEVMYPAVMERVPDVRDDILESYEEHHVVEVLGAEILALDESDERFAAKMAVLMEAVEHHVEEEEQEWFPLVREHLSRADLREIGDRMEALKPDAPRRPGASAPRAKASGRR